MYKAKNNIKKIRKKKGLTQIQLQQLTGFAQKTISRAENESNITVETICKYAHALDVHPNEIVTYEKI